MAHLSADLQREVLVALGFLVVPGALVLGAASAHPGRRPQAAGATHLGWLSPTAGFLLLTLVAVDLVPDAVAENAALGGPLLWVLLPAGVALVVATVLLGRPTPVGCCPPATGLLTALALIAHGLLEGFVVGLGAGAGLATGLGVLLLFAGHRFAEGLALGTALRAAQPLTRRATGRVLVALAAVTPLVGGDAGLMTSPGPRLSVVLTAVLAGVLAAAGVRLLVPTQPASERPTGRPVVRGVHPPGPRVLTGNSAGEPRTDGSALP